MCLCEFSPCREKFKSNLYTDSTPLGSAFFFSPLSLRFIFLLLKVSGPVGRAALFGVFCQITGRRCNSGEVRQTSRSIEQKKVHLQIKLTLLLHLRSSVFAASVHLQTLTLPSTSPCLPAPLLWFLRETCCLLVETE